MVGRERIELPEIRSPDLQSGPLPSTVYLPVLGGTPGIKPEPAVPQTAVLSLHHGPHVGCRAEGRTRVGGLMGPAWKPILPAILELPVRFELTICCLQGSCRTVGPEKHTWCLTRASNPHKTDSESVMSAYCINQAFLQTTQSRSAFRLLVFMYSTVLVFSLLPFAYHLLLALLQRLER